MRRNKGISLIVLIITIIIMIILAGIIILNLTSNNIINQAKESKFKTNSETYNSEFAMYLSNRYLQKNSFDSSTFDAQVWNGNDENITGTIKECITSITKEDGAKFKIQGGKLVYVGTEQEEKDWLDEIGILSESVVEPVNTDLNIATATLNLLTGQSMTTQRYNHKSTLLTNGKVLITGGALSTSYNALGLKTAELYDSNTGVFTQLVNEMQGARYNHSQILLSNGKVLIVGGNTSYSSDYGYVLQTAVELYDPATNIFTKICDVPNNLYALQAFETDNNKILIFAHDKSNLASKHGILDLNSPPATVIFSNDNGGAYEESYPIKINNNIIIIYCLNEYYTGIREYDITTNTYGELKLVDYYDTFSGIEPPLLGVPKHNHVNMELSDNKFLTTGSELENGEWIGNYYDSRWESLDSEIYGNINNNMFNNLGILDITDFNNPNYTVIPNTSITNNLMASYVKLQNGTILITVKDKVYIYGN